MVPLAKQAKVRYEKQKVFPQFAVHTPSQIYETSPVNRAERNSSDRIALRKFIDPTALASIELADECQPHEETRTLGAAHVHESWTRVLASNNADQKVDQKFELSYGSPVSNSDHFYEVQEL
jgi:hypothetical protein